MLAPNWHNLTPKSPATHTGKLAFSLPAPISFGRALSKNHLTTSTTWMLCKIMTNTPPLAIAGRLSPGEANQNFNSKEEGTRMEEKYTLHHGCHNGTYTSRDTGNPQSFNTYDEAYARYLEHRKFYRSIGYQIWFAYIVGPDGSKTHIEENPYY